MNSSTWQHNPYAEVPMLSDGNGFDPRYGSEYPHYLAWYERVVQWARKHPRMPLPPPPPPNAQYAPWPQPYSFEEWTQRVHRWYSYVVERSWAPPTYRPLRPPLRRPPTPTSKLERMSQPIIMCSTLKPSHTSDSNAYGTMGEAWCIGSTRFTTCSSKIPWGGPSGPYRSQGATVLY